MWIRRKHIDGFPIPEGPNKWIRISHGRWMYDFNANQREFYEVRHQPKPTPKQREALTRGQILRYLTCADAQLALARRAMYDMRNSSCPDSMMMFTDGYLDTAYQLAQLGRNRISESINRMQLSNVERYVKPKEGGDDVHTN